MDYQMDMKDKGKTDDDEELSTDKQRLCEEIVFKKARYAWQIKGHANTDTGETSCLPLSTETCESSIGYHESIEDEMSNNSKMQKSIVKEKLLVPTIPENIMENMTGQCSENETTSSSYEKNYIDKDLQMKSNNIMTERKSFDKRKCVIENSDEDHTVHKRVRGIDCSNNYGNTANRQLLSGNASPGRFVNLQAGVASAASNSDFSRALSSVLPNFQGFDIPSFIWQKQEMGCAIVDNVFNRTLEEMGLSPDPVVNLSATTRLSLENQSIESAIRNQGLRARNPQTSQQAILDNMEQMRRNASREDFEHTQTQLSRMISARQQVSHSVMSNNPNSENCAMTVQTSEQDHCKAEKTNSNLVPCTSSFSLGSCTVSSKPGCHGDHKTSEVLHRAKHKDTVYIDDVDECPEQVNDHLEYDDMGDADRCVAMGDADRCVAMDDADRCVAMGDADRCVAMGDADRSVALGDEDRCVAMGDADRCVAMGDTDSLHYKDTEEKHPENVLDLAVSAAILNQGLTLDSV